MSVSSRAGHLGSEFELVDIPRLISDYYEKDFDRDNRHAHIAFGTSGHRGSSCDGVFLQKHIQAITQAIVILRKKWGYTGPVFLGRDTHALSEPAFKTTLEVLTANGVDVIIDTDFKVTPTPVISYMIVRHNKESDRFSDGIILTPSHNPPDDGGFKYNPAYGGPAVKKYTKEIETLSNEILLNNNAQVKTHSFKEALNSPYVHYADMQRLYIEALAKVIRLDAIACSDIKIAVNPQGGSALSYFEAIADRYKLNIDIINKKIDPTFQFMPYDYNGKIRMDCVSAYTMQPLCDYKGSFDVGVATDPDADRHGIVTADGKLLLSANYLSIMLHYLLNNRELWKGDLLVGKNIGSSALIDKIAHSAGYEVYETAIGFKWVSELLYTQKLVYGCEDSAGASFLDLDGKVMSSDKDGISSSLLAAEIMAICGKSLNDYVSDLNDKFGSFYYSRQDVVISREQKEAFGRLNASALSLDYLGSSRVVKIFDSLHGQSLGGIKVLLEDGFFAVRPSGTENLYKIYYESQVSKEHAQSILDNARKIISKATGL
ncbi:Phosphoglucomutase [Anaerobiospirillum thomasii]|uniref:alpha-D-glucose phosphate-specific phosphoglucomutase n=1 Tax=Anaerobiospirillum thomasii TaxID=179995 RepID=UPI000D84D741|nr:alpha-D-glucose phosphate-specific phosphoglucomutase [Anaerobiospirillum thomasii]SPT68213.1 Phosphoglucomutase [Anaerobiospirillum thomasii]